MVSSRFCYAFPVIFAVSAFALAPLHAQMTATPQSGGDVQNSANIRTKAELHETAAAQLSDALNRIAQYSRDVNALTDAGFASLQLDDPRAAMGFFGRAETIDANNPYVIAGQGAVLTMTEQPQLALEKLNLAEARGIPLTTIAPYRGLAYDLVGNNRAAQQDYRYVLDQEPGNSKMLLCLSLSLAISGAKEEAHSLIEPMLYEQNKTAWRYQAFILAIQGNDKEAARVLRGLLPPAKAERMMEYLEHMPKLSPAQQVAAAHFGVFPASEAMGISDPRNSKWASATGAASAGRTRFAATGLVPVGTPLGRKAEEASEPQTAEKPIINPKNQASAKRKSRNGRIAEPSRPPENQLITGKGADDGLKTEAARQAMALAENAQAVPVKNMRQLPTPSPQEVGNDSANMANFRPAAPVTPNVREPNKMAASGQSPAQGQLATQVARDMENALLQSKNVARVPNEAGAENKVARPVQQANAPVPVAPSHAPDNTVKKGNLDDAFAAVMADLGENGKLGDANNNVQPGFASIAGGDVSEITVREKPASDNVMLDDEAKALLGLKDHSSSKNSAYWLILGEFGSMESARIIWKNLQVKSPENLSGKQAYHNIASGKVQLMTGPFDDSIDASRLRVILEGQGITAVETHSMMADVKPLP